MLHIVVNVRGIPHYRFVLSLCKLKGIFHGVEMGVCSISRCLKGHIFDRFSCYSACSEGHFLLGAYPPYRGCYEGHISEKIRCQPVILKGIFLGEIIIVCPISRLL